MQALILSTLLQISSATWRDPVQISWNGAGMKICDQSTPETNACPTPTTPSDIHDNPCILESSSTANVYYGPFNGAAKMLHEFEASCPFYANMTVRYLVAFCGVDTSQQKVHNTLSFNYKWLTNTKTNFHASSGNAIAFNDAALSLAAEGCANFFYTVFEFGPFGLGPILADTGIPINIRNRLETSSQWAALFNVSVECTAQSGVPPEPFHALRHDSFCVNLEDVDYDGEYAVTEMWVNDNYVFVKDDSASKRYLYSCVVNEDRIWVFGEDTSCATYMYACTAATSPENPLDAPGFDDCVLMYGTVVIVGDEGNDAYTIQMGDCEDHYKANIFGIRELDLATVRMLLVFSTFSFIFGMLILYWCQSVCYWLRDKNYKSVASKEIDF